MKLATFYSPRLLLAGTCALALALAANPAQAALITYDEFDYAPGVLDGLNGGTAWHSPWDTQSDGVGYVVASGSPLSFGSLQISGNYANGGGSYQSSGRRILANAGSGWDNAGNVSSPFDEQNLDQGVVWSSMLVRVDAAITSWDNARIFFHSSSTPWQPDGAAANNGLQLRINGGASNWGISKGRDGSTIDTGVAMNIGTVYLFVAKFELSLTAGLNNAYVWLFENPASVTLAGPDLLTSTANASLTGLNSTDLRFKSIGLYLDNTTDRVSLDEIRLGTSFADVTPIPEPSALALLLGGLALSTVVFRARKARVRAGSSHTAGIKPTKQSVGFRAGPV